MLYKFLHYPEWRSQLVEQKKSFAGKTKQFFEAFNRQDSSNVLYWNDPEKDQNDAYYKITGFCFSENLFGFYEWHDQKKFSYKDTYCLISLNDYFLKRKISYSEDQENLLDSDLSFSAISTEKDFSIDNLKRFWRYFADKEQYKDLALKIVDYIDDYDLNIFCHKGVEQKIIPEYKFINDRLHGLICKLDLGTVPLSHRIDWVVYSSISDFLESENEFSEEQRKEIIFYALKNHKLGWYDRGLNLLIDPTDFKNCELRHDYSVKRDFLLQTARRFILRNDPDYSDFMD